MNSPTQKTLLLFIIRDVCNSPLSVLEATLFEHLQSVWLAVLESHTLEPPMSDYFDLEFIGLPHMKFLRDQFDSDVQNLGQRFKDSEHPNYLFESAYHRQVGVDELPIFMKKVWVSPSRRDAFPAGY